MRRYLGGSTNLWGGGQSATDDIDLKTALEALVAGPSPKELVPYYERAKTCNLGPFSTILRTGKMPWDTCNGNYRWRRSSYLFTCRAFGEA